MKYMKLIKIEEDHIGSDTVITVRHGFFLSWQRTYVGTATVWHEFRTGKRPDPEVERRLSEMEWVYKR